MAAARAFAGPCPVLVAFPLFPVLVGALALAGAPASQDSEASRQAKPGAEGPLQNDVFLPVDRAADDLFKRGDEALARARTAAAAPATARDAERLYNEAFDVWRTALANAPAGASVRHPSERSGAPGAAGEGESRGRLTEGVEAAALARVRELSADERARWRERASEPAAAALAVAGRDAALLAGAERGFPGTAAAVRAALSLADQALAEGRTASARGWCRRASAHLALAPELADASALRAALERRSAWLQAEAAGPFAPEDWPGGDRLIDLGSIGWPPEPSLERAPPDPRPGRGVRPGAAFLADGRVAVQTASRVLLFRLPPSGPVHEATFEPAELLGERIDPPPLVRRADNPGGWPLLPATNGTDLYLVQGRAAEVELLRRGGEPIPNALLCLRPPPPAAGMLATRELPELRWAVTGDLRLAPGGEVITDPALAELRGAELQPGPVVAGDTLVVQARSPESEVRAFLLGFDLDDGSLRWSRFLAKGADLVEERSRIALAAPSRAAGQPLCLLADGLVFASTHLGSGHLVDPLDGRVLWSLRARRRPVGETGWTGDRPRIAAAEPPGAPGGAADPLILWAAADSDRLYALRPAELTARADGLASLFARPPLPIGAAEALLGAGVGGLVLQGSAGRERTVFWLSADGRERREAVSFGRAEDFAGVGITGGERALAASDHGLYLFDLSRELYLADHARLVPIDYRAGGELFASGERVVIVGPSGLWAFQTAR